jgi:hypothetical protein
MAEQKLQQYTITDSIFGGEFKDPKQGFFNYPTYTDKYTGKTKALCTIPKPGVFRDMGIRLAARLIKMDGHDPENPFDPKKQTQLWSEFNTFVQRAHSLGIVNSQREYDGKLIYNEKREFSNLKPKFMSNMCIPCMDPDVICKQANIKKAKDEKGEPIIERGKEVLEEAHGPRQKATLKFLVQGCVHETNREKIQEERKAQQDVIEKQKQAIASTADEDKEKTKKLGMEERAQRKANEAVSRVRAELAVKQNPNVNTEVPLSSVSIPDKPLPAVWKQRTFGRKVEKKIEEPTSTPTPDPVPAQFANAAEEDEEKKVEIDVSEVDANYYAAIMSDAPMIDSQ